MPRNCNVSSPLVWVPPEMSSRITPPSLGVSTSINHFPPQASNVLHHSAHQQQLLRHPFHQQPHTIVDHQHHTPQSQGISISQSPLNLLYNSQSRNTAMSYPLSIDTRGKGNVFAYTEYYYFYKSY